MSDNVITSADYKEFCVRGRQVLVQLRAPMYMGTPDDEGHIGPALGPHPGYMKARAEEYKKETGNMPTGDMVNQWLEEWDRDPNAPTAPIDPTHTLLGELDATGALLVLTYGTVTGKKIKATIHPLDVQHVTWVPDPSLIQSA